MTIDGAKDDTMTIHVIKYTEKNQMKIEHLNHHRNVEEGRTQRE